MDLTIIIVNWNGGDLLHDCLASIDRARAKLQVQVIVVDNASRDGSRERAQREFPQFEVINSGANIGFGRANNLARPLVKSDLVLFLNPDTVLLGQSLVPMVEFARQHPEVGAVGCKMRYPNGEIHEQGLQYFPSPWTEFLHLTFVSTQARQRFKAWLPYLDPNQSGYVIKLYGGCLLCRKSVLDEVDWFDGRYFMYAEDVDLCRSILDRGLKLYYLSSAEIVHVAGGTSGKAPSGFSILMKAESIAKLMAKYYGAFGCSLYRALTFVGASIRLTALGVLRVLSLISPLGAGTNFVTAFFKYRLLLLWSVGLKKPVIAK
jgi:GT2 family glycosyltransferase